MKPLLNFDPVEHKYRIETNGEPLELVSVTTLIHMYMPEFETKEVLDRITQEAIKDPNHTYYAMSQSDILNLWEFKSEIGRARGSVFHNHVETYLKKELEYQTGLRSRKPSRIPTSINHTKGTAVDITKQWSGFMNFRDAHPWILYQCEQCIYSLEDRLAGTPDAVFKDPTVEGGYILVDWKTSKELRREFKTAKYARFFTHWSIMNFPALNYWEYALQVNIYSYMLGLQGIKITKMFVIRFGDDCGDMCYQMNEMPFLTVQVDNLMKSRRSELNAALAKNNPNT